MHKRRQPRQRISPRQNTEAAVIPAGLDGAIAAAGCAGLWITRDTTTALTDAKGAYLLALRLDHPVAITLPRIACELPPGWYLYAGSARGSGGIAARVKRHLRPEKKLHWHIDRLTVRAAEVAALAVEDGHECALVAGLVATGRFKVAIEGFGSSDCRRCAGHLLTSVQVKLPA